MILIFLCHFYFHVSYSIILFYVTLIFVSILSMTFEIQRDDPIWRLYKCFCHIHSHQKYIPRVHTLTWIMYSYAYIIITYSIITLYIFICVCMCMCMYNIYTIFKFIHRYQSTIRWTKREVGCCVVSHLSYLCLYILCH